MPQNKINIALLLGDPSGIGPELGSCCDIPNLRGVRKSPGIKILIA